MSIFCNSTKDCNLNGDIVLRTCYLTASFSEEVNFCDCSNWYGWVGETCDEISVGLVIYNISAWIALFWSGFLIFLTGRTIILNYIIGTNPTGIDPIFYTGFFIFLSVVCLFIVALLNIIATLNPTFFELKDFKTVVEIDFDEEVTGKGGFIGLYCLFLSGLFFLFSALTIMLSWNRVIQKAARFRPGDQVEIEKRWGLVSKVVITIYSVIFIIILTLQLFLGAAVMLFIATLLTTFGFIFFGRRFIKTTTELFAGKSSALDMTIKLVRQSYRFYAISVSFVSIFIVLYYFQVITYTENVDLGGINHVQMFRDLGSFASLAALTHASWYFNSVTEGVLYVSDTGKCSNLLYFWDAQSFKFLDAAMDEEFPGSEKLATL